jgi:sugar O-acyltransferase (sialic acid O-acetyltransferase NeuD family)
MKSIAILGASGHGKVIADIAEQSGFTEIVFFDDTQQGAIEHWKIAGTIENLLTRKKYFDAVVVAIGNNQIREEKMRILIAEGAKITSLVHPSATVSKHSSLGIGSIACAGAIIGPFVTIGAGSIINTGASIDHDCQLGEYVHISPGAHLAGNVRVGSRTWIGIGASVNQQLKIGADVTIGASSAVIKDIPSSATAVGIPAIIIK